MHMHNLSENAEKYAFKLFKKKKNYCGILEIFIILHMKSKAL